MTVITDKEDRNLLTSQARIPCGETPVNCLAVVRVFRLNFSLITPKQHFPSQGTGLTVADRRGAFPHH